MLTAPNFSPNLILFSAFQERTNLMCNRGKQLHTWTGSTRTGLQELRFAPKHTGTSVHTHCFRNTGSPLAVPLCWQWAFSEQRSGSTARWEQHTYASHPAPSASERHSLPSLLTAQTSFTGSSHSCFPSEVTAAERLPQSPAAQLWFTTCNPTPVVLLTTTSPPTSILCGPAHGSHQRTTGYQHPHTSPAEVITLYNTRRMCRSLTSVWADPSLQAPRHQAAAADWSPQHSRCPRRDLWGSPAVLCWLPVHAGSCAHTASAAPSVCNHSQLLQRFQVRASLHTQLVGQPAAKHRPRNPTGDTKRARPLNSAHQQTQSPHASTYCPPHAALLCHASLRQRGSPQLTARCSPRTAEAAYGARYVTAANSLTARSGARPAPHDGAAARTAERLQPSRAPRGPSGTTERSGPAVPPRPPRDGPGPAAGSWRGTAPPPNFLRRGGAPGSPSVRSAPPHGAGRPARPAGPTAAAPGCPAPRTAASEHGTYLPPAVPHRVAPLRRGPGARLARDRHSEGRAEGNAARALALSRPSSRVALETARGAKRGRRKRRFKGGARACSPRVTWAPPSQWATADGGRRSTTDRGRWGARARGGATAAPSPQGQRPRPLRWVPAGREAPRGRCPRAGEAGGAAGCAVLCCGPGLRGRRAGAAGLGWAGLGSARLCQGGRAGARNTSLLTFRLRFCFVLFL